MLLLVLSTTLLSAAFSCQNMRIMALDKSVVVGRTLEFTQFPVDGAGNFLVTEQAGTVHEMPKLPNCETPFSFTSDYKVVRFRVWFVTEWANTTLGGMNDEGLSVSTLYFTDFAKFKNPNKIKGSMCERAAVPQTKLATYILSKYSSVKDLKSDLNSPRFPIVWNQPDLGNPTIPVHYAIHDRAGRGLVLEYTKQEGLTFYDNTVGAMTNAPDYGWHMENLKNYPNIQRKEWKGYQYQYQGKKYLHAPSWTGTGFTGIPGDYSSPSRFIKAATLVSHLNFVPDAEGAVNKMFHLLNTADIPQGIISGGWGRNQQGEKVEFVDYTWWMGVYDLSRNCVYFRGYDDLSIKKVCLSDIPDVPSKINVEGEYLNSYIDVSAKLVPMS
ncbi:hypothetical protein ACHWQZ_G004195 [Mnemiopsis leidyi]